MNRGAAGEVDRRGPKRIVRRRDKDLITRVYETLHTHNDQFAYTVADVDILCLNVQESPRLVVQHYRFSRGEDPLALDIPLGIPEVDDDIVQEFVRGVEPEGSGITDVQFRDPVPFLLEAPCLLQSRPSNVVTDVAEFFRFIETRIFTHHSIRRAILSRPGGACSGLERIGRTAPSRRSDPTRRRCASW